LVGKKISTWEEKSKGLTGKVCASGMAKKRESDGPPSQAKSEDREQITP
jgi:hypothetical protein